MEVGLGNEEEAKIMIGYFIKLKNFEKETSSALMSLVSLRSPSDGGFLPSIFWMYLYSISESSASACCVSPFWIRSSFTRWENFWRISPSFICLNYHRKAARLTPTIIGGSLTETTVWS